MVLRAAGSRTEMDELNPYQSPTTPDSSHIFEEPERSLKWLLFSFDGRCSRGDYWKGTFLAVGIPLLLVLALLIAESAASSRTPQLAVGIFALLILPMLWASLAVSVKRWHDRDKSGWWVLIGAIPYLGSLWVLIELGCLEGTHGDNRFGRAPLT